MNDLPDDDATVRRDGAPAPNRAAAAGRPPPLDAGGHASNPLPTGTRLGEFEIRGIIGEGGFSIVYLAWDHSLQRNVALKEYIPAELAIRDGAQRVTARSQRVRETFEIGLRSFVNEARLLASFDHQSLVKVHRFWEERGTAYMVMPWYRGPTLKDFLAATTAPPSEAWLRRLLDPLTEALAVLHEQSCFHRDIAPDNIILLGAAQAPLLLDFGAARRVIGNLTHDLTAILKKGYAPLEQYGEIPDMQQGPWTDIYALAAVVHFAIRGYTPPPAVARLVNDTCEPLRGSADGRYGARFLGAIDHALAIRPEHRTASIAAFRKELGLGTDVEAADAGAISVAATSARGARSPARGVAASTPAASGTGAWRTLALVASALLVGVVAVAGAAWVWQRSSSNETTTASARSVDTRTTAPAPALSRAPMPALPASAAVATPSTMPMPELPRGAPTVAPGGRVAGAAVAPASVPSARDGGAEQLERERSIAAEKAARRDTDSALDDYRRLAGAEKRDSGAVVRAVAAKQAQAQAALGAGRYDDASRLDRDATASAVRALNGLIDELVKGYARLAAEATAASENEIAQTALARRKKIEAMRR